MVLFVLLQVMIVCYNLVSLPGFAAICCNLFRFSPKALSGREEKISPSIQHAFRCDRRRQPCAPEFPWAAAPKYLPPSSRLGKGTYWLPTPRSQGRGQKANSTRSRTAEQSASGDTNRGKARRSRIPAVIAAIHIVHYNLPFRFVLPRFVAICSTLPDLASRLS